MSITKSVTEESGIAADRIVAYGDSRTDVPLFQSRVLSVAVNATTAAEQLVHISYRGDDLTEAYELARFSSSPDDSK